MSADHQFCPQCGAPRGPADSPPSADLPPAGGGTTDTPNKESRRGRTIALVVLVVVLVGAGIGIAIALSSKSHSPSASLSPVPAATTTTVSPQDVCGLNLSNWVIAFTNNAQVAGQDAFTTFGSDSVIDQWIGEQSVPFDSQATSDGQSTADKYLDGAAATFCQSLAAHGVGVGQIPAPPAQGDPAPVYSGVNPVFPQGAGIHCVAQQFNDQDPACFPSSGSGNSGNIGSSGQSLAPTTTTSAPVINGATGPGPGTPPGSGEAYVPAIQSLVTAFNTVVTDSPPGITLWMSKDPTHPSWFWISVVVPQASGSQVPNDYPYDGFAYDSPNGWQLSLDAGNPGWCEPPSGPINAANVPMGVLSDFNQGSC